MNREMRYFIGTNIRDIANFYDAREILYPRNRTLVTRKILIKKFRNMVMIRTKVGYTNLGKSSRLSVFISDCSK